MRWQKVTKHRLCLNVKGFHNITDLVVPSLLVFSYLSERNSLEKIKVVVSDFGTFSPVLIFPLNE